MPRPLAPLVVILAATLAIGILVDGSLPAQACPLTDGTTRSGDTVRQPDASKDLFDAAGLPGDSKRPSLNYMGFGGLGAIAGLFAIAMLYKTRRRALSPVEEVLLHKHPECEHPELVLTGIPKEALPSPFDAESVLTR